MNDSAIWLFNSKSPEWGEARLDRRGILVGEMVSKNDLIVLNRGMDFTFRREAEGSIINVTIAAPRLASKIGDRWVLEVITLSDHQCIEFSIQERSHPVNTGRGGKGRSPSWNTKRLNKDKLQEHLEETRRIDELGWAVCWVVGGHCAGGEAESCRSMWPLNASPRARAYRGLDVLVERPVVCPASGMPHSAAGIYPLKGWSSAARGKENSKITRRAVPKTVPNFLRGPREELFTLEELKRAGGRLKANTASGIDGVPNEILKDVFRAYPQILLEAFNSCLR